MYIIVNIKNGSVNKNIRFLPERVPLFSDIPFMPANQTLTFAIATVAPSPGQMKFDRTFFVP
jgi:hypothetical protein